VHVANATGGKKLSTRNASRRVARAGKYRRAGVIAGSFRIEGAKMMLPGKKAAIPRVSSGGDTNCEDFSPYGRPWLASLHSQDEVF